MSLEQNLARIADALERIAGAIAPATPAVVDGVEHIPTMTAPPLAWFDAGHGCAVAVPPEAQGDAAWIQQLAAEEAQETAQTTWDWLGVLSDTDKPAPDLSDLGNGEPHAVQVLRVSEEHRQEMDDHWASLERRAERGRRRRGKPLKCGRCRREGRSRMNHSNRCVECQHEDWWDE